VTTQLRPLQIDSWTWAAPYPKKAIVQATRLPLQQTPNVKRSIHRKRLIMNVAELRSSTVLINVSIDALALFYLWSL
jgi:hypothetical protein